ncbi:hypothetical protein H8L32_17990 [Undibacterium sp. CY18W]|uniref:DUF3325 domain-containing protein n=1 Tax=Undibacterium hunanense TaxID=2762292 RepID=A0ABR6ZU49_9BURK|nr:hypothetical protein [Undibacterium hunanense]MBC3919387.1 hypothetical protein [Undibacterium hunanense]
MIILALLLSWLAALCLYLTSPHQHLWLAIKASPDQRRRLLILSALCCGLGIAAAWFALGWWAGFFSALTALMLGLVVLPYFDAYRRTKNVG